MRHLFGTTASAIGRRGVGVQRLGVVTLARDPYAEPPGPVHTVYAGERTEYRAAAWVQDDFARPDGPLGTGYLSIDGGLLIEESLVRPGPGPGIPAAIHEQACPREQWAELTLAVLSPGAQAGLILRATADGLGGYLALASAADVQVGRFVSGVGGAITWLGSVSTSWTAWDVFRVTIDYRTVRVYRGHILLLEVVDVAADAILTSGHLGMRLTQPPEPNRVRGADFLGGALRQEYTALVLDMGDAQMTLGLQEPTASPVSFGVTMTNLQTVGNAPGFATLIRHGRNTQGTFDLPGSPIRVLTAFEGASAALVASTGLVENAEGLTETQLSLQCRGRDAFLEPFVEAGHVTYLPGPVPGGSSGPAPIPDDPCAPSPDPTVIPGEEPDEPDWGDPDDGGGEGGGPEAPDEEDGGEEPPLTVGFLFGMRFEAQSETVPGVAAFLELSDRWLRDKADISVDVPYLYSVIFDAVSPPADVTPPEVPEPAPPGADTVVAVRFTDQREAVGRSDLGPRWLTDTYNGEEHAPLLYTFEIEGKAPEEEPPP